ncbi:hypothetical protein [uncultured Jannaschia sp.]|uniref:hypothetical protein n=1 Tax=uncultured Jannaschia sp. TaxID=293347 RepID=UPI00262883D3|nr:hypothetical protein [uncultured Jannaschia sp.]
MPRLTQTPPVTLHLGAHRSASSSLQRLLERNETHLGRCGTAIWTPRRTRAGLLTGVLGDPGRQEARRDAAAHRAAGRVAMLRHEMSGQGMSRLIVSDENGLGGLRENVLMARLYPTVSGRLARLSLVLPGIDRVCLCIRSPDSWWSSAFAFLMTRGFAPPDRATLDAIVAARRGWRDVIADLAAALPDARLTVWDYDGLGGHPETAYAHMTGHAARYADAGRVNASPGLADLRARLRDEGCFETVAGEGDRFMPFAPAARDRLRTRHAADLAWLRAGADGLATYIEGARDDDAPRDDGKGRRHERQGHLRQDGRLGRAEGQMGAAGRG